MELLVNNYRLNVIDTGNATGMPVIFIHGFPLSQQMWQPQLTASAARFRVLAYDVRGHGVSEIGDGQYTIEFFVDDLMAIMDHLHISQAVVCGLSMGGYIALRAIEREPGRFKGLVLCDTRSEADTNEAKIRRAESIKAIQRNGMMRFADDFVKLLFADHTFKTNPGIIEKIETIIRCNPPTGACSTLLALAARTDTTQVLEKIQVPTLILVGEHDELTPPKDAKNMQKKIKGAELAVVPGAAHLSNIENPEFFNEKLLNFLTRIQ